MVIMQALKHLFGKNSMEELLVVLGITILCALGLYAARRILAHTLSALNRKIPGDIPQILADTVKRTSVPVILVISVYAGSETLTLPHALEALLRSVVVIAALVQVGIWGHFLAARLAAHYLSRKGDGNEVASGIGVLTILARIVVWTGVALLILDNLGFNITTLVAGLGIGGIAIALAAQHILGDLFASLSILLDKPFRVGEFIIVGDMLGLVEYIGLKTSRIRSLSGEELVFSNSDLLSSRIRNYKTMRERRVVFSVGVEYSTPFEKVKRIPRTIREIIQSIEGTRFDRSHFSAYADSSLNFETVYYVLDPDYNRYMDVQQAINLGIFEAFEKEGVIFAFPTRTVHLQTSEPVTADLSPSRAAASSPALTSTGEPS
jgi:small-conductance mechanosensitive channel